MVKIIVYLSAAGYNIVPQLMIIFVDYLIL